MIERKIYYIWVGNAEKPEIFHQCYESWQKNLPGFEIIEINENNFDIQKHLTKNKFFRVCYQRKMWAFVSDYIRTQFLYDNGGIYVDIDMEIVKDFSPLLDDCEDFLAGYESVANVNCAIVGAKKGSKVLEEMLKFYSKDIWNIPVFTIPRVLTYVLEKKFGLTQKRENTLCNGKIQLYPKEYFYPFGLKEEFTVDSVKETTYGIHWWNESWGNIRDYMFLRSKHMKQPFKSIFEVMFYIKHFSKFIKQKK